MVRRSPASTLRVPATASRSSGRYSSAGSPTSLNLAAPHLRSTPPLSRSAELDRQGGQLAHELHELPRGQRDRARPGDRPRHRDARADLEVRGREAEPSLPSLDQDVGQDRQRLARLDDVLQELQCTQQWLASDLEVHVS